MLKRLMTQQHTALGQRGNNVVVGLEDMLTGEDRRISVVNPIPAYRVINLEVITAAHLKILETVRGCRMNTTGARLSGHMIAQNNRNRRFAEGWNQQ